MSSNEQLSNQKRSVFKRTIHHLLLGMTTQRGLFIIAPDIKQGPLTAIKKVQLVVTQSNGPFGHHVFSASEYPTEMMTMETNIMYTS